MATLQPAHWEQDACHTAQGDRLAVTGLLCSPGVSFNPDVADAGGADSLAVTAGTGMAVDVDRGMAYVAGSPQQSRGYYAVTNLTPTTVSLAPADASDPRIDLIVAQVADSEYGEAAPGSSGWDLVAVTGTAEPSPSTPAVPDSALVLAEVLVPAGATSPGTITDRRAGYTLCPGRIDMRGVGAVVGLPDPPPSDDAAVSKVYADRAMHYIGSTVANVAGAYVLTDPMQAALADYRMIQVILFGSLTVPATDVVMTINGGIAGGNYRGFRNGRNNPGSADASVSHANANNSIPMLGDARINIYATIDLFVRGSNVAVQGLAHGHDNDETDMDVSHFGGIWVAGGLGDIDTIRFRAAAGTWDANTAIHVMGAKW